jgi:hypothetical protein
MKNSNSATWGSSRAMLFTFLLSITTACGGSSGGSTNNNEDEVQGAVAGAGDFLIMDAPLQSLLAFSGTVSELRLEIQGGGSTVNLIPADVSVEFLGLRDNRRWLSSLEVVPLGTYTGVRLVFTNGSFEARTLDGSDIGINAGSDVLLVNFDAPVVVDGSGYYRFEIDLDLGASLSGDVGSPPLDFTPSGSVVSNDGDDDVEIDEIKGVVSSIDRSTNSFVLDAFVDDDYEDALGELSIVVPSGTLVYGESGTEYASRSAFFDALVAGSTALEVHGDLGANRILRADKIEIEDQFSGSSVTGRVEIEGIVRDIVAGVSFDLTIREIEKSEDAAETILGGLGDPSTISVSFDMSTLFFLDSNSVASSANLRIGQEVKVRFSEFMSLPFPASKVEIDNEEVEFEGSINSVLGLPGGLTMRLDSFDTAVLSGQVDSASTDVTVDLSNSSFELDTEGEPDLSGVVMPSGLELEVEGTLAGPSSSPTITATEVEVRPGKFEESTVASIDVMGASFMVSSATIDDPFGGGIVSGPLDVLLSSECVFEGDAETQAEFFALFTNLEMGETLEVEVKGIATANANEVLAFEIEVEVAD